MKTVKKVNKATGNTVKATAKKVVNKVTKVAAKTVTMKKPTAIKMKLKTVKKAAPKATEQKTATNKTEPKAEQKTAPKATEPKAAMKGSLKVITNPSIKNPAKTPSKAPAKAPATTPATTPDKPKNEFAGNPYRAGSYYAMVMDCLFKMGGTDKPVNRKALLEAYCKASGKSEKLGRYDLAVILSPTKTGEGHRSSRKNAYWIERLEDGLVKLHMSN